MNFKEINEIIQGTRNILENEFNLSNIKKSKEKNKYSCISCNSSDGLHLYSDTNTCHCFSCHTTWNVVNFTMEVNGIDYINALKYLNDNYNLNLPIKTNTQIKKAQTKLEKSLKEYKKILIEKETQKFKENENEIYEKIKEINLGELDYALNEEQKDNLIKELDNILYNKKFELEHKKEFINDLSLEFMTSFEISEMLEIENINPKQKIFINSKTDLLNKALEIDEQNRIKYLEYFYNLRYNEYINYSKYKANVVVDVNRYIAENNRLEILLKYKRSLLIAPTGSGKTYTILKMFKDMEKILKKQGKKVCFIVPNATQVQQIQEEYGIKGAWHNADQDIIFNQNTISCYTWDKFGRIEADLSNTIVLLDEVHQIYTEMYRKDKIDKMIENLSKCNIRIDITATPNKLDFKVYDYILEYKQKIQTKYKIKAYKYIDRQEVLNIINNSKGKVAVFENDITNLEKYITDSNKKGNIIHANNKNTNITYLNIVKNGSINDIDLLCNTSVIIAGVNIIEPNMTDIILVGVKDVAQIKQYIARFRNLESVNVHIFNNYKEISKVYSVENLIKNELNKIQNDCNNFNKDKFEGMETELIESGYLFNSLNSNLLIYKFNGIYVPDTISLRNKEYTRYYNNADIISFVNLLEEYFTDIEIIENDKADDVDFKEAKKEANEVAKECLEKLEKHSQYLVGYYDIQKNSINSNLKTYLKNNKLNQEKVINYIHENNLSVMLENLKVKKKLNSFSKLVTEKEYSPNLAYKLSTMNNKTKTNFINKVNVLLFETVRNNYKEFMELNEPNIILYNFILDNFTPTISYDDDTIVYALDKLSKEHNINLKNQQLKEYIHYVYIVDSKKIKISKKETTSKLNNNKNNSSMLSPNNKKEKRIYYPVDYHTLDSICKEYGLNDIDKKCIKSIMDKKIDLIKIKKDKIQEIINIFN